MPGSLESLKAFLSGSGRAASRLLPGVVVFGAGKGGVGTSALSGMVGLHLARHGASVLLVDADETAGSLHLMFGLPANVPGLGHLRGGDAQAEDLLVSAERGLHLLPGGGGGLDTTLAVAAAERRILLRRVAALYERFDVVLVDGGSRLDSVMAACAVGSGRLVAVTTPNRIAEAASFALIKVARGRFPELPMEVAVNRATDAEGREAYQMVDAATSTFLGEGIRFTGVVPADPELERHVAHGGSLCELSRSTPAVSAAARIAEDLLTDIEVRVGPPAPVVRLPLHDGVADR